MPRGLPRRRRYRLRPFRRPWKQRCAGHGADGNGKTLAFLIPVIEKLLKDKTPGIAALVLCQRASWQCSSEQYNALRGKQLLPPRWLSAACPKVRSSRPFARERGWW